MAGMNRVERTMRRHLIRAIENGKPIPPIPLGDILADVNVYRRRRNIKRRVRVTIR